MILRVLILLLLIITYTEVSWSETTKTKPKDHECSGLGMSSDAPSAVWKMKNGSPTPVHVDTLEKAVTECLR